MSGKKRKQAIVIGAGFAGISAATTLASKGYQVVVLEKNEQAGGRARHFGEQGFHFDMGPSWYWMPDVFDSYFARFGKKVSDYYQLKRLDPGYRVYFEDEYVDIPADLEETKKLFESYEKGAGEKLQQFLDDAAYKYKVGINKLVYYPSVKLTEFADPKLLFDMLRMNIFRSMSAHIRKYVSHPKLIKLLEFPVLFLGETAQNIPALYSLMNYADLSLGTWYPEGGMSKIVDGMVALAEEKGVEFVLNTAVEEILLEGKQVSAVRTESGFFPADLVISGADYAHTEQKMLNKSNRNYSENYWKNRTLAPSSLLFYLGIDRKLPELLHHNLFFDEELDLHAHEIYKDPKWPSKPLFYASVTSKTDPTAAPEGSENLFLLMPVAPDVEDTPEQREKYFSLMMDRLEKRVGVAVREHIVFKRSYAHKDFTKDYNSLRGNAYGLANTLKQTAILKPSLKNKSVTNLFYTGQLTVPGPGVPPSLISGQLVADYADKHFKG